MYSTSCTKLFIGCAFIGCVSLVNCIIIFKNDEFIIDTPFKNIKNAVTTGNMKCGLQNEGLKLHEHKYNGSHIIFRYKQNCDTRSMLDYPKKEDIYFNEFMSCNVDFVISTCGGKAFYFEFNDTCAIEFNTACEERFLGPCIPSPNNSIDRIITLQLGNDTVEFSTEEIQRAMGKAVICDPTSLQNVWHFFGKYFDKDYQTFRYGSQICAIKRKVFVGQCPPDTCCYPGLFNVQDKYGQKSNKKPVKKTDSFNK